MKGDLCVLWGGEIVLVLEVDTFRESLVSETCCSYLVYGVGGIVTRFEDEIDWAATSKEFSQAPLGSDTYSL